MLFSKACQYAILAMIYLAARPPGERISIREISEGTDVPAPFLGKIISSLARSDLVVARRGPNGGAMLNRTPAQVTVGDIVAAMDGPLDARRCILGLPECSDLNPCALHSRWKVLEAQLGRDLHNLTLDELLRTRRRPVKPDRGR